MALERPTMANHPVPFGPEMLTDPYSVYRQWRTDHPVVWAPALDAWLVSSYAGVAEALRSPSLVPDRSERIKKRLANRDQLAPADATLGPFASVWDDPAAAPRLRRLVSQAFTPGAVAALEGRIQQLMDTCLVQVSGRTSFDVIEDLANQLPVRMILELLGLPSEDADQVRQWSDEVSQVVGGNVGTLTDTEVRCAVLARGQMVDYVRNAVRTQRPSRNPSLLTTLARVEEAGDRLSEAELYHTAVLLLIAGHTTTTNLIGNGILALLRHPQHARGLPDAPAHVVASAVEETLRFDSPVQFTTRIARAETTLEGTRIRPGEWVYLLLGAANRDPARFADPDRFDPGRSDNRHLSFSAGVHSCLGAPLARLEAQVVFRTLWLRFPRLRLGAGQLDFQPNFNLRGLKTLPVDC